MNAPAKVVVPFTPTPKQREANVLLTGEAMNILLRGGSRSGKSFIIVRRMVTRALRASGSRHAVWRQHFNHAKASIGMDTFPKVLKLCFPELAGRVRFSHEGIATFPNGSELWLAGLDDKERVEKILGMEFATNFFNEISTMSYHAQEIATSRLAQKVEMDLAADWSEVPEGQRQLLPLKNFYDMNPGGKRHWSHDMFVRHVLPGTRQPQANPGNYVQMRMNPADNADNLPASYFEVLAGMSATKRTRFEKGEWANDVEGALWNDTTLDACRIGDTVPEELVRVVVGVDPSGSGGKSGKKDVNADANKPNDIGIVAAGIGKSGTGYVLEDATLNASPGEWAQAVRDVAERWNADKIVVERNFGGAMAEFTIKTVWPNAPLKMITSSIGKALRAEPVAALYEPNQRKVKHLGYMGELEDQMAAMMPQPTGYTGDGSPDRLDAAVFALTELMLTGGYTLGNLD